MAERVTQAVTTVFDTAEGVNNLRVTQAVVCVFASEIVLYSGDMFSPMTTG